MLLVTTLSRPVNIFFLQIEDTKNNVIIYLFHIFYKKQLFLKKIFKWKTPLFTSVLMQFFGWYPLDLYPSPNPIEPRP